MTVEKMLAIIGAGSAAGLPPLGLLRQRKSVSSFHSAMLHL